MANSTLKKMQPGSQLDVEKFRDYIEADLRARPVAAPAEAIPEAVIAAEARASLVAS